MPGCCTRAPQSVPVPWRSSGLGMDTGTGQELGGPRGGGNRADKRLEMSDREELGSQRDENGGKWNRGDRGPKEMGIGLPIPISLALEI